MISEEQELAFFENLSSYLKSKFNIILEKNLGKVFENGHFEIQSVRYRTLFEMLKNAIICDLNS